MQSLPVIRAAPSGHPSWLFNFDTVGADESE
jgi:hypothetical protein